MSDYLYTPLNATLINSFNFKYPLNTTIIDIKIHNLNIFSKVIPRGKISIWGNYTVVVVLNMPVNNNNSRNIVKSKKVNFHKVFIYKNALKDISPKNIKSSVEFLSSPQCFYTIKNCLNYSCVFRTNKLCNVILFSQLLITLSKNNVKNISKSPISENYTSKLPILQNYTHNILDNKKNISNKYNPFPEKNAEPICKNKKLIQVNSIIGRGSTEVFIEKNIILSPSSPQIWHIENINTKVEVTKLDLIHKKSIASGFIYMDITYKTNTSTLSETTIGSINYIEVILPFSTSIDLTSDNGLKICKSDCCQLITAHCLSEIHHLKNPTLLPSKEIVYNEIFEQLVISIKVLVTRKEELYINI